MGEIRKIIFWQPIISPHYAPMMRALCQLFEEVVLVVVREQDPKRREQGWILPDTGAIRVISLEKVTGRSVFCQEDSPSTLHIFSGTRGYPAIWKVFKFALRNKSNCAIVGETLDWHGIKGILRFVVSVFDASQIRSGLRFILAKGKLGVWWYKRVFYPPEKIFEWAYFVEEDNHQVIPEVEDRIVRFIYVGRLSPEKGIKWLLRTFQQVDFNNFELHIVGDGPLKDDCLRWAKQVTKGTIQIHGQVPIDNVRTYYAGKDYLILPSTGKDGWGAVVNEAFQYGLPCIVSKKCGASSLLTDPHLGYIIDPKQKDSLLRVIQEILRNDKKPTAESRDYIRTFSSNLSPGAGALFLKKVIEFSMQQTSDRPMPPWCKK